MEQCWGLVVNHPIPGTQDPIHLDHAVVLSHLIQGLLHLLQDDGQPQRPHPKALIRSDLDLKSPRVLADLVLRYFHWDFHP